MGCRARSYGASDKCLKTDAEEDAAIEACGYYNPFTKRCSGEYCKTAVEDSKVFSIATEFLNDVYEDPDPESTCGKTQASCCFEEAYTSTVGVEVSFGLAIGADAGYAFGFNEWDGDDCKAKAGYVASYCISPGELNVGIQASYGTGWYVNFDAIAGTSLVSTIGAYAIFGGSIGVEFTNPYTLEGFYDPNPLDAPVIVAAEKAQLEHDMENADLAEFTVDWWGILWEENVDYLGMFFNVGFGLAIDAGVTPAFCVTETITEYDYTFENEKTLCVPEACFPNDAVVHTSPTTTKTMDELNVGDMVLTSHGFSPVYAFAHKDDEATSSFLKLSTASGHSIELSPEHRVFTHDERSNTMAAVAAKEVRVGDLLLVNDDTRPSTVTAVRTVSKKGLHAPYTVQGSVVVNGVLASSYDDTPDIKVGNRVLHLAMTPLRLMCSVFASACGPEVTRTAI